MGTRPNPDRTANGTGFDAAGRRVANQAGIITRYGYEGAGRLLAVTNAWGTNAALQMVTQFQYDEAGNEIAQIDALSRTTSFTYDSMGRRTKRTLPGLQFETFGYDLMGNLIRNTNFNAVIITNQFDALNRLTNRSSAGYSASFAYSLTGQRTSMTDVTGTTSYGYDNRDIATACCRKRIVTSQIPIVLCPLLTS